MITACEVPYRGRGWGSNKSNRYATNAAGATSDSGKGTGSCLLWNRFNEKY
jgi:hypothetical protein